MMSRLQQTTTDTGHSIQMTMHPDNSAGVDQYDEPVSLDESDVSIQHAHADALEMFFHRFSSASEAFFTDPETHHESDSPVDSVRVESMSVPAVGQEETTPKKEGTYSQHRDADPDGDAFVRDLTEILQGQKTYRAEFPSEQQPSSEDAPAERPSKEIALTPNEHSIFEKIAQSMKYANSYDLGDFHVAQRLDDFDREMSKPPVQADRPGTDADPDAVQDELHFASAIDDLSMDQDLKDITQPPVDDHYNPSQPLRPDNGGIHVTAADLIPGDLIVFAEGTVLKTACFLGPDRIVKDGKAVQPTTGVVLRHAQMSSEKASQLSDWFGANPPAQEDLKEVAVKMLPVQMWAGLCQKVNKRVESKCLLFAGRIDFGIPGDEIRVGKHLMDAFTAMHLQISTSKPDWSETNLLSLAGNGALKYAGHIKLK